MARTKGKKRDDRNNETRKHSESATIRGNLLFSEAEEGEQQKQIRVGSRKTTKSLRSVEPTVPFESVNEDRSNRLSAGKEVVTHISGKAQSTRSNYSKDGPASKLGKAYDEEEIGSDMEKEYSRKPRAKEYTPR